MKTGLRVYDGEGNSLSGVSTAYISLTAASAVAHRPRGGGGWHYLRPLAYLMKTNRHGWCHHLDR
jgi:hypothetical protein